MNKIRKLENNLLAAIAVYAISVLGFAVSSFLLFINKNHQDVPLGFLFAGAVIGTLYLVSHFLILEDEKKESSARSITSVGMRLFIIIGVLILLAFMNYRWNIHLFNIFVFIAVYTFGTIIFVLSFILFKERKE